MKKKKTPFLSVCLFFACCCLFLLSCTGAGNQASPNEEEITETNQLHSLDVPYETFQKVVGWLSEDTILVHLGDLEGHSLISFNIFSGEWETVYEDASYLLTVDIHASKEQILVQEVKNEESNLTIISKKGEVLSTIPIHYSGYANIDWNPMNPELIFVAYYHYDIELEDDQIKVLIWNTEEDILTERPITSLSPKWYSANVYLYVNEMDEKGLYIGDIREDDSDLLINQNVSDFFLNEDTFIGIVDSDIVNNQVHLFHEYPLLVSEHVMTIPKVTMNDFIIKPHMTQSKRNGKVYGVLPAYSFALEEELGEYVLAEINFEEETTHEVTELTEDAPILLCPDERYLLHGWRYESIIDLETSEIVPLISDTL